MARLLAIAATVIAALLLGALSFRDWTTRAPRSHPLAGLASWWPSHPAVATEQLLIGSALAAKSGSPLSREHRARLRDIIRRDPLGPQPFLVEGAVAQIEGDTSRALRLYRAARLRNPRDPAARLLLADLELRTGGIEDGLANLVAISRIDPDKSNPLVPALAEYAKAPGTAKEMRRLFENNHALAQSVLTELAANPSNSALIQALAPNGRGAGAATWQQRLLDSTLSAGKAAEAKRLWTTFHDVEAPAGENPFNPRFQQLAAPPPFNWTVASGSGALAELRAGGGLAIVHFGREPAMLARQLVLLAPGRYTIETSLDRPAEPGRLEWRLQCLDGRQPQAVSVGARGGTFLVSPDCGGYWLELHAAPDETEQQMGRTLTLVRLRKLP